MWEKASLPGSVEQITVRGFGHAEILLEERSTKTVYRAEVDEVSRRDRSRRRRRDGIGELVKWRNFSF